VFTPPNNERDYIKRVIGLPGDTVEVKSGQVYVNGVVLDEPYLKNLIRTDMSALVVEESRYFVMGDNRNNLSDSRAFGTITPQSIVDGPGWCTGRLRTGVRCHITRMPPCLRLRLLYKGSSCQKK
jgi:signal peptidase I